MKLTLLETVASRLDPRLRLCSWEGPGWGAAVVVCSSLFLDKRKRPRWLRRGSFAGEGAAVAEVIATE